MRIAIPTTSYPRFEGDVAGVFVRALCLSLVARGHRCVVLVPASRAIQPLGDAGIEVVQVEHAGVQRLSPFYGSGVLDNVVSAPLGVLGALAFPFALARALRRVHRQEPVESVLSQWALPCAWSTHTAIKAPHVAVWHSGDVYVAARLGLARGRMEGWADRHVFVAAHLKARLGLSGEVIPMGIDVAMDATRVHDQETRPLRVLSLGRLVSIKRVDRALAALAGLSNVELVIAGDGPERPFLERLATTLRVNVRFVGRVDEGERAQLFAWADVLVATSGTSASGRTEGYPVSPREALAAGVVVVATDEPAHRALKEVGGEGVLVVTPIQLRETLAPWTRARGPLTARSQAAIQAMQREAWPSIAERLEHELELARVKTQACAHPGAVER